MQALGRVGLALSHGLTLPPGVAGGFAMRKGVVLVLLEETPRA
jgi:hypothetical protein